ncbi:membrane protein insertase YidC [Nocardia sp. alder85J]|uniref:membrane protein insertase YidC n=1 Tax=Nocardia sp. alder85J TaxID=2862949 RepID=UPI001CD78836|nr:membrane protein insertase YidC [Nocardia sp. alder85J]MCX4092058.1 membrane protein insertase YidC [Nocardia sp. alder85J]
MLDFVYYPVSAVLWLWHTAFAALFGAASGLSWALAIIALVVTLRAALYRPFLAQVKFSRTMAIMQPQMKRLQAEFADDRERLTAEVRKLQQQHEFSVLRAFTPMLVQLLIFLGLYHVLRSFDRTGPMTNLLFGTTARSAPAPITANYVFSADQVQSFLHAKILSAPLTATLAISTGTFGALAAVALPLIAIAAFATHSTARAAATRQLTTTPQTRLITWMTLWLFPLGTIVAGLVMPIGILIYFATSNTWTFAQQYWVHRRLGPVSEAVPVVEPQED